MTESSHPNTPKRGVKYVHTATFRAVTMGERIAIALQGLSAKTVAERLRRLTDVSARTVESWNPYRRMFDVVSELRGPAQIYPTGSNVRVVYPPGRPERARLRPELPDGWMQSGLLLAATMLGAGSARLWWRLARRRARRHRVVTPSE